MNELATPAVESRLPHVGTTIFSVMSALAQQHGAVNLGQGFPDFDCDPRLIDAVDHAMRAGHNQYPPMSGVPALREAVAQEIEALYGRRYDPGSEITDHGRRDAGDPDRDPRRRASGRRGDRSRALLRQLRAQHRAGRRQGRARAAGGGQLPPEFRRDRRRPVAAHAGNRRQHAAQPERHRLDGRTTCAAWPSCCAAPMCWSSPTRSTSTWSSTAPAMRASRDYRNSRRAASSSRASARPTT